MDTKPLYSSTVSPATGNLLNLVALLFHLLPKNLLSFLTGAVARLRLPPPLSTVLVRSFAQSFGLAMDEAEHALERYRSVEDLFTRRLRPGVRPVVPPLCSPADGYLARSAPATAGTAVQAKGLDYPLPDLVLGQGVASPALQPVWYQTIYLAPHNYHRVHAPFSGKVERLRYIPGQLWPVNVPFVLRIPRLFARNERLVFDFALASGGRAWVVMVGAFNVGRMVTRLDPYLVTNALERQMGAEPETREVGHDVAIGDELGIFMLGSTVILVFDQEAVDGLGGADLMLRADGNRPILMGQTLLRGDHD